MIFSGGSNAAVTSEAVARMCSAKKVGVLINFTKFTGKRLCQSLLNTCNFTKKETLALVLSSEF